MMKSHIGFSQKNPNSPFRSEGQRDDMPRRSRPQEHHPKHVVPKIVPWPHEPGQFEKIEVRPVERIQRMGINFEANLDDEKI